MAGRKRQPVDPDRAEWEAYAPDRERDIAEEIASYADDHDYVPDYTELRRNPDAKPEAQEPESKYKPLETVLPSNWNDADVPKRVWYWEGLIPFAQVSILSAEGGTGKSLLGAHAGVASSIDLREFLGRRIMSGPVLYLAAEDDEDEFKRRLHDVASHHGVMRSAISRFHLIAMADQDSVLSEPDKKGAMLPTETWHRLVENVKRERPVAVFLDTAADLFGGDEIKRSQVRQFVAMLRTLAISHQCAVVLLYHPSRSGIESGKGESGSTAWFNSARAAVFMTSEQGDKNGDVRRIRNTKANYGKKGEGFLVRWQKGVFILVDPDAPPTPEDLKRRSEAKLEFMSRFLEHVSSASASRLTHRPQSTHYAPKVLLKAKGQGRYDKDDFVQALNDLLDDGKLEVSTHRVNGKDVINLIISQSSARKYEDRK